MVERPRSLATPSLTTVVAAAFASCTVVLLAQEQKPVFRAGTDLVVVDVTVIDSDGNPVADLKADEFVVTIGGQRRPVRTVEFLSYGRAEASSGAVAPANQPTPASPAASRVFVLLFDDLSIRPAEARGLLAAAQRVIATEIGTDDLVGVTTTSGLGPVLNPTKDRDALRKTLADRSLIGRYDENTAPFVIAVKEALDMPNDSKLAGYVQLRECAITGFDARVCPEMVDAAAHRLSQLTLERYRDQLRAYESVIRAIASAPAPRVVIALSNGVPIGVERDIDTGLVPVSQSAAVAGVIFYALAELGNAAELTDVVNRTNDSDEIPPQFDRPGARRATNDFLIAGVQTVAAAAGGDAFKVSGQADGLFRRVIRETSGQYRLGVEVPLEIAERGFFEVKASVTRRSVTVRARRHATLPAATAAGATPAAATAGSVDDRLRAQLAPGATERGVPIEMHAAVRREPNGRRLQVIVGAEVPGTVDGPLLTMFALLDASGKPLQSGKRELPATGGDSYITVFPLSIDPGSYRLRFAAASAPGAIGSAEVALKAELLTIGNLLASDVLATVTGATDERPLSSGTLSAAVTSITTTLELYPTGTPPSGLTVRFQLKDASTELDTDEVSPSQNGSLLVAARAFSVGDLPTGTYTITASIMVDGKALGSRSLSIVKADR